MQTSKFRIFREKCNNTWIVDLYSLKVYAYPMHSRKQILQKMKQFYDETKNKRNKKNYDATSRQ